ncbi:MAG: hypothetical protein ACNA7K_06075 [Acholeplasmataceae bacterium]
MGQKWELILVKRQNIEVTLLNYGARIYELKTPDFSGKMENIVLAYHNLEDYIKEDLHLNATLGPIAGRLKSGILHIEDQCYKYQDDNQNQHILHGGEDDLSYCLFDTEITEKENVTIVSYKTILKSKVKHHNDTIISIDYQIMDSSLFIKYHGVTSQLSYLNLSNHFYFNLSGSAKRDVLNQMIRLNASKRYRLDKEKIPFEVMDVEGAYDFNQFKTLKKAINYVEEGLDDIYLLDSRSKDDLVFEAYDSISCRYMSVSTSYEACVLYTHNSINNKAIKPHNYHRKHYAFCVEFQNPPYHLEPSKRLIGFNKDYNHIIKYTFKNEKI